MSPFERPVAGSEQLVYPLRQGLCRGLCQGRNGGLLSPLGTAPVSTQTPSPCRALRRLCRRGRRARARRGLAGVSLGSLTCVQEPHAGYFVGGAALWFGRRESVPSRKRPPQTGQTPVLRAALSWLMLDGAAVLPVPVQLPWGTLTRGRLSAGAAFSVGQEWCSFLSCAAWFLGSCPVAWPVAAVDDGASASAVWFKCAHCS